MTSVNRLAMKGGLEMDDDLHNPEALICQGHIAVP